MVNDHGSFWKVWCLWCQSECGTQWLWWPDKAVKEAQIASCWSSSPHICTYSCSHISPQSIVGKMPRHVCAIFQACCANFFASGHTSFFAFCFQNRHIRWMKRHPASFRGGQTSFLVAFYAILRQISNCFFGAISLRELSVCAIFYAFSNYASELPPLHAPCKYKEWTIL